MKLKLDANGNVVLQDGKPVYIKDDNTEIAFDAASTVQTISRLNAEAKTHREGKEAAEATLAKFKGIEDPAAAIKALGLVKQIDEKQLVDSKGIEALRTQITGQFEGQLAQVRTELEAATKERDEVRSQYNGEKVGNAFATSKFIADKIAVPVDMLRATFGSAFKVEDGNIVAYDSKGAKIFSPARIGETANFDEAIETLVNGYTNKNSILKGSGANGGGGQGNNGGNGGKMRVTRAEYDKMDHTKQRQHALDVRAGKAELVD